MRQLQRKVSISVRLSMAPGRDNGPVPVLEAIRTRFRNIDVRNTESLVSRDGTHAVIAIVGSSGGNGEPDVGQLRAMVQAIDKVRMQLVNQILVQQQGQ